MPPLPSANSPLSHPFLKAAGLVGVLVALGTLGYVLIAGWGVVDALYMTVATLSTVGIGELHPLSPSGRLFTTGLILLGVGVVTYLVSSLGQYVAGGVMTGAFRERRMQHAIDRLTNHYIVCGYGRVGRQVVSDLRSRNCPVVAIEIDAALRGADGSLGDDGVPTVIGDAEDDAVLVQAGIARARGLVATTGNDAANLVITLSARALNPALVIVARASQPETEAKLLRAGASHVVSPYVIGGRRMARQLVSPGISAFLDTIMDTEQLDLWLEEAAVAPGSPLVGQTVGDAIPRPRSGGGINLIALRRAEAEKLIANPAQDIRLAPGDQLIAVGSHEDLQRLVARARSTGDAQ